MLISYWDIFQQNFKNIIINHNYYNIVFNYMVKNNYNILLYSSYGFPIDLFIDEIIKSKYSLNSLQKKECKGIKDVIYLYNHHFLEFDLMHPSMSKNFDILCKYIISIIKNKNINDTKHLIIIKHLNLFNKNDFSSFRIILERFHNNAFFICTTHKINKIDIPVKSRFNLIRMPLFEHHEIDDIFEKYLKISIHQNLKDIKTRDIIKAIYIAHIGQIDTNITTKEFCTLNYPPLADFINKFDKRKNNLEDIKQLSYKCFQYNISIPNLVNDLLIIMPNKEKIKIINIATDIEHLLSMTNKCREPLYIEAFLCNLLL